jgi:hypothetical protein
MTFVTDTTAAEAYDRWFDHGWGKYAFRVETKALLKAASALSGLRVLDVGAAQADSPLKLTARARCRSVLTGTAQCSLLPEAAVVTR